MTLSISIALKNRKDERRSFFFWSIISVLMVLLGINKQLDLQSLFTEIGRQIARHQGWMDQRRDVQFWFIVVLGIIAMISFVLFIAAMRDLFKRYILAFVGLFVLISFIIIRAVSFHHVDELLGSRVFDIKMNWLLELTGIYTIFVAGIIDIIRLKNGSVKSFV